MKIGDVCRGTQIGLMDHHRYVWHRCDECAKERWQLLRKGQPQTTLCASCAAKRAAKKRNQKGEHHPNWKGGRQVTHLGYIKVKLPTDSPFSAMADKDGYVYEHRLVMARTLGRCLESVEEVHHRDHNKHNNDPANLELSTKGRHNQNHTISRLLARIRELEAQITK